MAIRFFDMFAGIGGFRSGLEAVGGFECIGHCEIDKKANQAYNAIYQPKGEIYFEDATKIDTNDLPDIDLICAGFPCQSFSVAGKRLGFRAAQKDWFAFFRNQYCTLFKLTAPACKIPAISYVKFIKVN